MLDIHTEECIDCDVCEPDCPVDAIMPNAESELQLWLETNTRFTDLWPNITEKGEPPTGRENWERVSGKITYGSGKQIIA